MTMHILPRSRIGKISTALLGFTLVIWIFLIIFAEGLDVIPDPVIYPLGIASVVSILLAFITGLAALIKKERALLVFLAVIVGLIAIIFAAFSMVSDLLL